MRKFSRASHARPKPSLALTLPTLSQSSESFWQHTAFQHVELRHVGCLGKKNRQAQFPKTPKSPATASFDLYSLEKITRPLDSTFLWMACGLIHSPSRRPDPGRK